MIFSEDKSSSLTNASGTDFSFNINSHSFSFVTKNLYEYPIRAIIRELASNAIDANRDAGKDPMDWTIKLPTLEDPTFLIEDNGRGMSEDDMKQIYPVMFKSTRSATNNAIGMFGLGCKTPFNYTSQYTVISCYNGYKNIYSVYKENGTPKLSDPLNASPIPTDKTGLTVSFNVNKDDFNSFYKEFIYVSAGWERLPNIINKSYVDNILDGKSLEEQCSLFNGSAINCKDVSIIFSINSSYNIYLEMGNVLYPVTFSSDSEYLSFYKTEIENHDTIYVIHANIGDVNVVPSREKLLFDVENKTQNYINHAIDGLYLLKFDYKQGFTYRTDYYYRHSKFLSNLGLIKTRSYTYFNLLAKNMFDVVSEIVEDDFNKINDIKNSMPEYTSVLTTYSRQSETLPKVYLGWTNKSDILELFNMGSFIGISTDSERVLKAVNTSNRGTNSKYLRQGIASLIKSSKSTVNKFIISDKATINSLIKCGVQINTVVDELNVPKTKAVVSSDEFDVEIVSKGFTSPVIKMSYDSIIASMKDYKHNFVIFNQRGKVVVTDFEKSYKENEKFSGVNNSITTDFFVIMKESKKEFEDCDIRFISLTSKEFNKFNVFELGFESFFDYQVKYFSEKVSDALSSINRVDRTKFFSSLSDKAISHIEEYDWGNNSKFYDTFLKTKSFTKADYTIIELPYFIQEYIKCYPTPERNNLSKSLSELNSIIQHNDFDKWIVNKYPMLKYVVDFNTFSSITWRNSEAEIDAINYIAEMSGAVKK